MVPICRRPPMPKKPSTIGAAAGDRGLSLFDVFLLDGDAAFAVDLDAGVVYDDLFDQRLHDHGIVGIHDVAAADVFLEGVQPCFIVVKDCRIALKFYQDMFGFELIRDHDGNMELSGKHGYYDTYKAS